VRFKLGSYIACVDFELIMSFVVCFLFISIFFLGDSYRFLSLGGKYILAGILFSFVRKSRKNSNLILAISPLLNLKWFSS
jgi:hypothetical protein